MTIKSVTIATKYIADNKHLHCYCYLWWNSKDRQRH